MRKNIRFVGAGGQGVILSSVLLARAYGLGEGYNISQTQSYGPEARGGACKAELVVSDGDIDYMKIDKADILVAYNQVGYNKYHKSVKKDADIIINSTLVQADEERFYRIPATEIAERLGVPMAVNIVMLGALAALLPDLKYETMKAEIVKNFDAQFKDDNVTAFDEGYEHMEMLLREDRDGKRKNVMVCVTKQKTCERLIKRGRAALGSGKGELSIIHVSLQHFKDLGNGPSGEALDYLYEKAMKYDANLTIIRSKDVVGALTNLIVKNNINTVILGESRQTGETSDLAVQIRQDAGADTEIIVVSAR